MNEVESTAVSNVTGGRVRLTVKMDPKGFLQSFDMDMPPVTAREIGCLLIAHAEIAEDRQRQPESPQAPAGGKE